MNGERRPIKHLALLTLAVVLAAFLGLEFFRVGPRPAIQIEPALQAIGKRNRIKINVSEPGRGLSYVKIEFIQGEKTELLAEKHYALPSVLALWRAGTTQDMLTLEVGRERIKGLRTGNAVIRVTADRALTFLRRPGPVSEQVTLPVRLSPPSLQVLSTKIYVAQGGAEVVVYRVGETTARDGVRSGEWWFPGNPLPGGGKQDRFAFFAVPYIHDSPDVRLIAQDDAQNQAEASIIDQFFPRPIRKDNVELTDAFMSKVVPEIMSQTAEIADRGSLLDNYLAINGELRRKQNEELKALASKSRAEMLWHQPFLMMPNGKVMAQFAQRRTYRYQGREVDQQDHLGYDLAVTQRAPVPVANSGVVVLARYFGIYGNTVIIDHGCGLMSLYGHLSSIGVGEGQQVARGDTLGQTGETGLAGGDHLHFAILLQGLAVNPVEWWDSHWIRDRIARKVGATWHFVP